MKKKILYYIVTLEWNIDPIKSKVRYVVEIFFFTAILIELCLNFGDNNTFENVKFLSKVSAKPTPILRYQNMSNVDLKLSTYFLTFFFIVMNN